MFIEIEMVGSKMDEERRWGGDVSDVPRRLLPLTLLISIEE
jgi:hypothetical protein